jgi:hypothetical protein
MYANTENSRQPPPPPKDRINRKVLQSDMHVHTSPKVFFTALYVPHSSLWATPLTSKQHAYTASTPLIFYKAEGPHAWRAQT